MFLTLFFVTCCRVIIYLMFFDFTLSCVNLWFFDRIHVASLAKNNTYLHLLVFIGYLFKSILHYPLLYTFSSCHDVSRLHLFLGTPIFLKSKDIIFLYSVIVTKLCMVLEFHLHFIDFEWNSEVLSEGKLTVSTCSSPYFSCIRILLVY